MLTSLLMWGLATAWADPCGMVPPIWTGRGPEPTGIQRTGLQETYVFFRDGVQTIAIRPGFTGSVEEFGMLVPLPAVPALRKIDDRTFSQLANAIDPPEVVVHVYEQQSMPYDDMMPSPAAAVESEGAGGMKLAREEVRVVKEEAVGMYEVAVLEAGSPKALQRWMDDHHFRYPDGMDATVQDYVSQRWMFVAIKAKVGAMAGVSPRPGMRAVDPDLPRGASFDGYVQGMAFRFEVDEPVIPMRLSVFNGDDTHNRVYVVAEQPSRINEVARGFVRRQVRGRSLHANLTEPLPVRYDGPQNKIPDWGRQQIEQTRNSDPYVAVARELVASDLMAVARGELSLPFEEQEKELLRINEALGLRGAAIDAQIGATVAESRAEAVRPALQDAYEMTLTVVDGDFDQDVLRERNLTLAAYTLPSSQNRLDVWNVRPAGPELWIPYTPGWFE